MIRCKTCKKQIDCSEEMIYYNGKDSYFCSSTCFTSFLSAEVEKEKRNKLYKQICLIFNIPAMTPKLFTEVKRVCEKEGLTYHNLSLVLHYMYDIKKIPIYGPTLYYVNQYVEEAKRYYANLKEKQNRAKEMIEKNNSTQSKIIKPNYKNNRRNTGLKINLEDL